MICSLTEIKGIWIYLDDDLCRWKVLNPALIRKYSKWMPDTKNRGDVGLKRRKECSWLACSHSRTALRIKDSRGAEPETRLDSKMFGTNLTFYWLKDWMIKEWLRLLCNMWRPWLYKLSEVTGRRRRRARAEFEKARRSLFSMQCYLKMLHLYFCVCFFWLCTGSYPETNVDCVWQLIHHDHSPCCGRFKAAQKIQAPVTQGWCMNSKGVQESYILLSHFFWRPVSSDSIPRFVCVTRDGTSETYLAQYTWYDDLK